MARKRVTHDEAVRFYNLYKELNSYKDVAYVCKRSADTVSKWVKIIKAEMQQQQPQVIQQQPQPKVIIINS